MTCYAMRRILWAPWRIHYVESTDTSSEACIFCVKPSEGRDEENLIVYRGRLCFVMLNRYPYNNGHLMVAPYSHKANLEELTDDELYELISTVRSCILWLRYAYKPHGFNIGLNIGRAAGAGVDKHIHVHIVPRWEGDTNFMPVISDVKVVSEALQQTYRRVREAVNALSKAI
ncbi:MAG: HIT domain-containing protein [Candidatus Bathyarchaeia archaeon]